LVVDESIIRLTPTEYRLIKLLLENQLVDDATLIKEAMQYPKVTEIDKQIFRTLERHIENIKSKLEDFPVAIRRVQRYGYALVPS
ncbi:MAG TPA: helix-turn-helix domain-containing protein, partial [Ktedonobacteraceae bacterium]